MRDIYFFQQQNLREDLASKINSSTPLASATVRSKAMVLLLFIHC